MNQALNSAMPRDAVGELVSDTLGHPVERKLTTNYITIAVEALSPTTTPIWHSFGLNHYVEAKNKNAKVVPLVITSGASGTAKDAISHSWMAVNKGSEADYMKDGAYSIADMPRKELLVCVKQLRHYWLQGSVQKHRDILRYPRQMEKHQERRFARRWRR
jgi:hypothetical protein